MAGNCAGRHRVATFLVLRRFERSWLWRGFAAALPILVTKEHRINFVDRAERGIKNRRAMFRRNEKEDDIFGA